MKPKRPAWITLLAVVVLFGVTLLSLWAYGPLMALVPLALTLAFVYDLTHHAKSRQVLIISRTVVLLALLAVILWGVWLRWMSGYTF